MKRPTSNPNQWSFEAIVADVLRALNDEDKEFLRTASEGRRAEYGLHNTLGRWIRNVFGLWEHGTERCVEGILEAYNSGDLDSPSLRENRFTHPKLPFDLLNTRREDIFTSVQIDTDSGKKTRVKTVADTSLNHPDNCSAVIIEAVVQRLRDE